MPCGELGIALPPSWSTRCDPNRGVLVTARSNHVPVSGVRPELTLRCGAVSGALAQWRESALAELADRLADFELEDEDEFDLGDHPAAYRRFAHRTDAADLVCDQWAWLVNGLGVTLTCTVARTDYADYCDVFEAIAGTVDPEPRAAFH